MTKIFQVAHILPTYFTRLWTSEITVKMRDEENKGYIVRGKRPITSSSHKKII